MGTTQRNTFMGGFGKRMAELLALGAIFAEAERETMHMGNHFKSRGTSMHHQATHDANVKKRRKANKVARRSRRINRLTA